MGFLKSCVSAVLLIALHACTGNEAQTSKQEEPAVTTPAPPATATPVAEVQQPTATALLPHFMVQDAAGNTLDIQSFKGKKLFVNLWATWCPPCRAEMPSIDKLYQAVNKEKVQFIMLSLDNDFELAKKYVKEKNLNAPIYYPASNLPNLFTVNGIPTTFIFDEAGQLITQHEGSEDYNTDTYRKLFGAVE